METKSHKKTNLFTVMTIKGFILGLSGIIPGMSGGVLAVSMGVSRPTVNAITGFFKDIKSNFLYLLPLGIGGVIGILSVSQLIGWLFASFKVPVTYALIGLVLGGVPSFMREANSHGFKKRYILSTCIGAAFIFGFWYLQRRLGDGQPLPLTAWTAMLCGGVIGAGTLMPGISTSLILIFLGLYEPFLTALNTFDISMLFFIGLGAVAAAVPVIFFVKKMFDKYHGSTHYCVFGFLIASIVVIFPGFEWAFAQFINILLLIAGFFASYFLDKLGTNGL